MCNYYSILVFILTMLFCGFVAVIISGLLPSHRRVIREDGTFRLYMTERYSGWIVYLIQKIRRIRII